MRPSLLLFAIALSGCAGPATRETLVGIYAPQSKDGVAVDLMEGGLTSLGQIHPELNGLLWLAAANWREERTKDGDRLVIISWGGGHESIIYSVSIRDGALALTKESGSLPSPFGEGIEYASKYRKEPNLESSVERSRHRTLDEQARVK